MPVAPEQLEAESTRATELLRGKVVSAVVRHREKEVLLEFTDGTRCFVDWHEKGIELSVTAGENGVRPLSGPVASPSAKNGGA